MAEAAPSKKYAAIVIDANTGKTLHSASADSRRYPASLTKMMTLYLVFEALSNNKIEKTSRVPFSAQAAAKPATKLGVRAGASISVETAIYALVTKSANDAATALSEYLGGSEEGFGRMMTAKARRLGMTGTVFRNASGLPNSAQFTTARDMAILGMALKEHFPEYYGYFSTKSFTFGKTRMGNHNRLLGRIKGVDGIKTGFTNASGFNLVTSVSDGDRRLVAVVMGGATGASRDNQMAELIKTYLPKASTARSGPMVASRTPSSAVKKASLPKRNAPTPAVRPQEQVAALDPEPVEPKAVEAAAALIKPSREKPARSEPAKVDPIQTASTAPEGWAVQVASSPSEAEARAFLSRTGKKASDVLAYAPAFTVPFDKNGTTYYRARFGGFASKAAANGACAALKKKKIDCYAVQG